MAVPKHEALIDLERTLSLSLVAAWNKSWARTAKKLRAKLNKQQFVEAHELVDTVDYMPIAKRHLKLARTVGNASMLLGASRITGKADNEIMGSNRELVLDSTLAQFEGMLGIIATEKIREKAHQKITVYEEQVADGRVKKDTDFFSGLDTTTPPLGNYTKLKPYRRTKPVKVMLGNVRTIGEQYAHLASNVLSSRMNSFGYISTALEQGLTHYQVIEVLDKRTCPVCREMDGRVFTVQQGAAHAMAVMQNDDPYSLRELAPFPSQKKENVRAISRATSDDLYAMGLAMPPYHPNCRGLIGEVTRAQVPTRFEEVYIPTTQTLPNGRTYETMENLPVKRRIQDGFSAVTRDSDPVLFDAILKAEPQAVYGNELMDGADWYDPNTHEINLIVEGAPSTTRADHLMAFTHEFGHHLDRMIKLEYDPQDNMRYQVSDQVINSPMVSFYTYQQTNPFGEPITVFPWHTSEGLSLIETAATKYDTELAWLSQASENDRQRYVKHALALADIAYSEVLNLAAGEQMDMAIALKTKDAHPFLANFVKEQQDGRFVRDKDRPIWANAANDFFGSLTNNEVGFGHPGDYYWRERGEYLAAAEMFANYIAMRGAENQAPYKFMQYLAPVAHETFDDLLRSYLEAGGTSWLDAYSN